MSLPPPLPLLGLLGALVLAAFLSTLARAGDEAADLEVGAVPDPFRLNDQDGKAVALGGGKDHGWFVLAFYPKAMTPGCTKEMCSLRDGFSDLESLGVTPYGISLDDVVSQRKFADEQHLPFTLLSDPDGSVARRFRVLAPDGRFTKRYSFVVDPKGVVRHVDRSVAVGTHAADLARAIRALQATDAAGH